MNKRISAVAVSLVVAAASVPPQASAQAASSTPLRASYLILRVSNLANSTAFFRDRVGLTLQMQNDERAVFDAGGVLLMLEQRPTAPSTPSGGLAALTEIVLESGDVIAAHSAMETRGVTFRIKPRPVTTDGTRDLYAADFRDPDGHIVTISGWVSRAAAQ